MQDRLLELALEVSRVTEEKVGVIDLVMRQTGMLAINARLEAARAGVSGNAFAVVANEMGTVAQAIRSVSAELRHAIAENVASLESAGEKLQFDYRGVRLTDLARNAVEIIDRNLYERSCDVRWWATDSAVVGVLADDSDAARAYASDRLGTILRSYTVYLDLWIADADGRVVANGRPDRYPHIVGTDVSNSAWFVEAMRTFSGDEFHVQDIERNALLGGAPVATYSTAVRAQGDRHGRPVGALGIFFDWAPQAAAIVEGVHASAGDREGTRALLLDQNMRVIAASDGQGLLETRYPLIRDGSRGYYQANDRLVAFALTPGYETYRGLGWYGCIEAPLRG